MAHSFTAPIYLLHLQNADALAALGSVADPCVLLLFLLSGRLDEQSTGAEAARVLKEQLGLFAGEMAKDNDIVVVFLENKLVQASL
jgi:hypothetical protein